MKLFMFIVFILFLCFIVEFRHEIGQDYRSIVTEIRGPHWVVK